MQLRRLLYTAFVAVFVSLAGTLLILFAKGYTLDTRNGKVAKTGWILAKSSPDGARVFLDDKLVAVTNNSISSLKPGTYNLRIQKEGYHDWEKELKVKEEFVTIVEAFLVSKAPEIRPFTFTGVKKPTLSHAGDQITYFATSLKKSGIWVLSLAPTGRLGINRNNPRLVAEGASLGEVEKIIWSSDDNEILAGLKSEETGIESFFLFETNKLNPPPYNSINPEETLKNWEKTFRLQKETLVEKLKLDEKLKEVALKEETKFSPDEKKFLYSKVTSNEIEYRVYNTEEPLPIGQVRDTLVLRTNKDRDLKIFWHTTSEQLLILEDQTINLIEIEGTNQTTVFSGPLSSDLLFPLPDGKNIATLMSFKKDAPPDLYAIKIN